MTWDEYLLVYEERILWLFKRFWCHIVGCDIVHWRENEYISGYDCRRCEAGEDTTGNETPFKVIRKQNGLVGRLAGYWNRIRDSI